MIFEEDYCELFEQELSRKGQDTLKFCELCELQKINEKKVSEITQINMGALKSALKS